MTNKTLKNLTTNEVIELDDAGSAEWIDEYMTEIVEKQGRYVGGQQWFSIDKKVKGRPITLSSRNGEYWLLTETRKTLLEWSNVKKLEMEYTHSDDRKFKVKFRHRDGAIEGKSIFQQVPEIDWHKDVVIMLETI